MASLTFLERESEGDLQKRQGIIFLPEMIPLSKRQLMMKK